MPQIISQAAFNPMNLQLDNVYIDIIPPPSALGGVPTDIAGLVGTASWGPVNIPMLAGSVQQLQQIFGSLSPNAVGDPHDLISEGLMLFSQAQGLGASVSLYSVRVTDGTDKAASALLLDSSNNPLVQLTSKYTGSFGNGTIAAAAAGANSNVSNLALSLPGENSELFANLPNSTFQSSLISAVNSGQNTIRPASRLITASLPLLNPPVITSSMFVSSASGGDLSNGTYYFVVTFTNAQGETTKSNEVSVTLSGGTAAQSIDFTYGTLPYSAAGIKVYMSTSAGTETFDISAAGDTVEITAEPLSGAVSPPSVNTAEIINTTAPADASYTFSGGTDGRSVTNAQLVGTDFSSSTGSAASGAYALRSHQVSVFAVCGLTSSTSWSALTTLADSEGMIVVLPFPANTSTTSAIATLNSLGIDDANAVAVKDWNYFFDSVNNVMRNIPPDGTMVGTIAALSPAQSPTNKQVFLVNGTDKLNPITPSSRYTDAELQLLEVNGINVVYNPIPAGRMFGWRMGVNTSSNPAENGIEYGRMINFLARLTAKNLGPFIGKLQSQKPQDPLRAAVRGVLNTAYSQLVSAGLLDDYSVQCDINNNPPNVVANHFMYIYIKAVFLSVVRYLVAQIQGGTTVSISVSNTLGSSLPGGST